MSILSLQMTRADVAVKSFAFRVVTVYAPNSGGERRSFLRCLELFLDDPKRIVLVGDWNAIFDLKIVRVERGARGLVRWKSSLIDFMARHNLVDRSRRNHPGREMWTWIDRSSSIRASSYLDKVLVCTADSDFVSCPTSTG